MPPKTRTKTLEPNKRTPKNSGLRHRKRLTRIVGLQNQRGGTILGYGKRSTLVYTIEDLLKHLPRVLKICIASFALKNSKRTPPLRCFYGGTISIESKLNKDEALQSVAIKDCGESPKALSSVIGEVVWNQKVHKWFSQADAIVLTSLHPTTSHLEVIHRRAPAQLSSRATNRVKTLSRDATTILNNKSSDRMASDPSMSTIQKRVLPVYRECDGSLIDLNIMHRMQESELLRMCTRVLQFLVLLHAKHHIHMDIKPDNILFTFTSEVANNKNSVGAVVACDFCLSDYETLEIATQVAARIRRKGQFPQGTDGYMSPLLTIDDVENIVHPMFRAVAKVCSNKEITASHLITMIDAAKKNIDANIYCVDLHSLALSLLDIILPVYPASSSSHEDCVRTLRTALKNFPRIKTLLPKLMYLGGGADDDPTAFRDAASALAAVQALMSR
jgi:hypothetical protein